MPRIRTLKPEIWQSESIGRVSRDARLLYVGLITSVDDSGRARGSSRLLASNIYPYDNDVLSQLDGWIGELEAEGMVRRYQIDGATYLDLPNFLKHQRIDKPTESRLPKFEEGSQILASPREGSQTDLGSVSGPVSGSGPSTGNKDLAVASQPSSPARSKNKIALKEIDLEFEIWFKQYPKKDGVDAAQTRYRAVRRGNRATASELLNAAMKYSQEKSGTDPTYIKTAKNWLNDGDWKNPPRARPTNGALLDVDLALEGYVDGDRHG